MKNLLKITLIIGSLNVFATTELEHLMHCTQLSLTEKGKQEFDKKLSSEVEAMFEIDYAEKQSLLGDKCGGIAFDIRNTEDIVVYYDEDPEKPIYIPANSFKCIGESDFWLLIEGEGNINGTVIDIKDCVQKR